MFRRLSRWTIRLGVLAGVSYAIKKVSDEFKVASDPSAPSPYSPPARTDTAPPARTDTAPPARTDKVHAPVDMANDAPVDAPPADKPPVTPPPAGNASASKTSPAKKAPAKKSGPPPPATT